MIPSRYMTVNDKSPYLAKKRVKNRKDNTIEEPAITVLSPHPFTILDGSDFARSPSPKVYRTVPPKSAKNKEASSFVILGDTLQTPVQSRPESPSGRISPFRGHGFKSPSTTLTSSRASSPCNFTRHTDSTIRFNKTNTRKKGNIAHDIGLPPKSPMKKREHLPSQTTSSATSSVTTGDSTCTFSTTITESTATSSAPSVDLTTTKTTLLNNTTLESVTSATEVIKDCEKSEKKIEAKNQEGQDTEISKKILETMEGENFEKNEEIITQTENCVKKDNVEEKHEENIEILKTSTENEKKDKYNNKNDENDEQPKKISDFDKDTVEEDEKDSNIIKNSDVKEEIFEKLLPVVIDSEKKEVKMQMPVSPLPKKANTTGKFTNSQQQQQIKHPVARTAAKPLIPPKRTVLKLTPKNENQNETIKKNTKELVKNKVDVKLNENTMTKDVKSSVSQITKNSQKNKTNIKPDIQIKNENPEQVIETPKINLDDKLLIEFQKTVEKTEDEKTLEEMKNTYKNVNNKSELKIKETEKLIFQPDKCHIAPPTMASPSPIITPSISTPSTTADLTSSTKNSQSISTAPTTVTSCSMTSVSSTVVLTGNLARKEIAKIKEPIVRGGGNSCVAVTTKKSDIVSAETNGNLLNSDAKLIAQMVKAGSHDYMKWNKNEKLSAEMSSATKIITEGPEVEVLSPNNLRNASPILPPPNMAWDEERVSNGDLPGRPVKQGKFRTFISAICRFFSYLFCCRCCNSLKCCKKPKKVAKQPSLSSSLSLNICCASQKCKEKCKFIERCENLFKCCSCRCSKPKCCEGSRCCKKKPKTDVKLKPKKKTKTNFCAKYCCSCKKCCVRIKAGCQVFREKINNFCRSLFCLNLICCQKLLKKCKCCHKLKCCQKKGCCSCCNPYVKREPKKLMKNGSRASTNSKGKDEVDPVLVEHNSIMKAAIPVLPSCLATFCFIFNLFIPGSGTFISGLFCLCFGKPRFSTKDSPKNRFKSFIVNTIIGIGQIFTTVFCLVGWGWSIWWGVIMCKLARRQKRIRLAEKSQREAEAGNVNQNRIDVEQG